MSNQRLKAKYQVLVTLWEDGKLTQEDLEGLYKSGENKIIHPLKEFLKDIYPTVWRDIHHSQRGNRTMLIYRTLDALIDHPETFESAMGGLKRKLWKDLDEDATYSFKYLETNYTIVELKAFLKHCFPGYFNAVRELDVKARVIAKVLAAVAERKRRLEPLEAEHPACELPGMISSDAQVLPYSQRSTTQETASRQHVQGSSQTLHGGPSTASIPDFGRFEWPPPPPLRNRSLQRSGPPTVLQPTASPFHPSQISTTSLPVPNYPAWGTPSASPRPPSQQAGLPRTTISPQTSGAIPHPASTPLGIRQPYQNAYTLQNNPSALMNSMMPPPPRPAPHPNPAHGYSQPQPNTTGNARSKALPQYPVYQPRPSQTPTYDYPLHETYTTLPWDLSSTSNPHGLPTATQGQAALLNTTRGVSRPLGVLLVQQQIHNILHARVHRRLADIVNRLASMYESNLPAVAMQRARGELVEEIVRLLSGETKFDIREEAGRLVDDMFFSSGG
jgi:hypothetical protein